MNALYHVYIKEMLAVIVIVNLIKLSALLLFDDSEVAAVVRALPSNRKVLGSNPGSLTFFSAKVDSHFHPHGVGKMSTSFCWGLTCDGLVTRPGGVNDSSI